MEGGIRPKRQSILIGQRSLDVYGEADKGTVTIHSYQLQRLIHLFRAEICRMGDQCVQKVGILHC